jgi:hypothetical protein
VPGCAGTPPSSAPTAAAPDRARLTQQRTDRRRRDPDPELGQLTPDPHAPPPRVLPAHPNDQLPNVSSKWRPPAGGVATVGPLPADEFAVPAQQRLRAHNERRPTRTREHPADRRHEQPVSTAKARPADLALEHRELMAKDHELDVVVQVAGRAGGQPECPAQQQIAEGEEHGPDLLPGRGSILRNALVRPAIAGFCALQATSPRGAPGPRTPDRGWVAGWDWCSAAVWCGATSSKTAETSPWVKGQASKLRLASTSASVTDHPDNFDGGP